MKHTLLSILLLVVGVTYGQTIAISASDSEACAGSMVHFTASAVGIRTPHYKWYLNSTVVGTDSSGYSTNTLVNRDTVKCQLLNAGRDTILATSGRIIVQIDNPPYAGVLSSFDTILCEGGDTTTLSSTVAGGIWSTSGIFSNVSGSVYKAVRAPCFECCGDVSDTLYYTVSNSCGTDTSTTHIWVIHKPSVYFELGQCFSEVNTICLKTELRLQGATLNKPCDGAIRSLHGGLNVSFITNNWVAVKVGMDTVINTATNFCGTFSKSIVFNILDTTTLDVVKQTNDPCVGARDSIFANSNYKQLVFSADSSFRDTLYRNNFFSYRRIRDGLDSLLITAKGVCGDEWSRQYVNNHPLPSGFIGDDSVCERHSVQLGNTISGGIWKSSKQGVASISVTGMVNGIVSGTSTISYTTLDGCLDTLVFRVKECVTEVDVYPTAFTTSFFIHRHTDTYNEYSLFDAIGRRLMLGTVTMPVTKVPTETLPKGTYLLLLTGNNQRTTFKLTKD